MVQEREGLGEQQRKMDKTQKDLDNKPKRWDRKKKDWLGKTRKNGKDEYMTGIEKTGDCISNRRTGIAKTKMDRTEREGLGQQRQEVGQERGDWNSKTSDGSKEEDWDSKWDRKGGLGQQRRKMNKEEKEKKKDWHGKDDKYSTCHPAVEMGMIEKDGVVKRRDCVGKRRTGIKKTGDGI